MIKDLMDYFYSESALCKNYRKDIGTCRTGCKKDVKIGQQCPYEEDNQEDCPCFK